MGSHDPFGYLKHKLWPKEKIEKGWESNWQIDSRPLKVRNHLDLLACRWCATYHWKTIDKGYNFALNLTSITRSYGPTKLRKSQFWEFHNFQLGSPMTKWHLGVGPTTRHKEYYKGGRWWLPPSPGCGESCESVVAHGLFVHQNCSNYALTNLLFSLCRSVWVIDLLVILLNPHLETSSHLSTPKVFWAKEHATIFYPSVIFTLWIHNWVHQGVWGCVIVSKMKNGCRR